MGNPQSQAADLKPEGKESEEGSVHADGLGNVYVPGFETTKKKTTCIGYCLRIFYVVLSIIGMLIAVTEIAVTVTTAVATKSYSNELSGRIMAMTILAVTAAAAVCLFITVVVAEFTKESKPIHMISIPLVLLALIQVIISGVSVRVSSGDEIALLRSVSESFQLASEDNPRHVKMWDLTQYTLQCCGVYSSEDYRSASTFPLFPPNVPISCCPSYDETRSSLVQERERETCKAKRLFYEYGCNIPVLRVFKETANMVIGSTSVLIVLEVIVAIVGAILTRRRRRKGLGDEAKSGQRSADENESKTSNQNEIPE